MTTPICPCCSTAPYEGDTVLRVFAKYDDAIAYGEALVAENTIEEFDVYEREVY